MEVSGILSHLHATLAVAPVSILFKSKWRDKLTSRHKPENFKRWISQELLKVYAMPIPLVAEILDGGLSKIPYAWTVLKTVLWLALIYLLKTYFGGASNRSERVMHSKVIMMTVRSSNIKLSHSNALITCVQGGTSGIGAAVARELASRGAQLVLLTQHALTDPFLVEYIEDLREATNNQLITAEQVDLSSLHSIRVFATKWVDNAPPRRLDMLILCANTMTPAGCKASSTEDGLESNWGINYMANFHLLSILSPALRAQPPDRDVRIIFGMCASYMGGELSRILPEAKAEPEKEKRSKGNKVKSNKEIAPEPIHFTPSSAYATSKLALLTFAQAFQKHLSSYLRPDKQPMNTRVIVVDPGWTRTPGMRRFLTFGSLWGLLLYLLMWPFWWLVLKSPEQGAQSFLYAAMEARFGIGDGGVFVKECGEGKVVKVDVVGDEGLQKRLWENSEKTVERLEKEGAIRRAKERKEKESEAAKKAAEQEGEAKGSGGAASKTPGSRRSKKAGAD